ncbi:HD-GYP domain-containing protein [Chitinimonas sp.]|uniref:HD-GYP domain-containing protein n=1 Tax=Chitinimonas sp. TaxID=1934313 RepID=UPI0035B43FB7
MANARVRQSDIQLGQALRWDVFDRNGRLLLSKGHIINSESQLERLVGVGLYADAAALAKSRNEAMAEEQEPPSVAATLCNARRRLDQLFKDLDNIARQGRLASCIDEIARQVDAACSHDPHVALAMVMLRQEGRYATRHMLDVAVVVRLVARAMGMTPQHEASLVAAALTMNISMADFQDELKQQNAPLTPSQRARMDRHPQEAHDLLVKAGVTDPIWLNAVLHHHERLDGSGYPAHLNGSAIASDGQLICLADIFCARVTPALYRPAIASNVILRGFLLERGKAYDPAVTAFFIKALGVYPAGLLVKLANGEIGIVVKHGNSPQTPVVASFINAGGAPMSLVLRRETDTRDYAITDSVDPKSFTAYVNMEAIWGAVASMKGPDASLVAANAGQHRLEPMAA